MIALVPKVSELERLRKVRNAPDKVYELFHFPSICFKVSKPSVAGDFLQPSPPDQVWIARPQKLSGRSHSQQKE